MRASHAALSAGRCLKSLRPPSYSERGIRVIRSDAVDASDERSAISLTQRNAHSSVARFRWVNQPLM
jgi:hypothetical protein